MIPGLDLEGRTLRTGIRDLLELMVLPGALVPARGSDLRTRARLHRSFQRKLEREGAETEVGLQLEVERCGIRLKIAGRADAIEEYGTRLMVTEVKTSSNPPDRPLLQRPDHVLQLLFYASALAEEHGQEAVDARLVYIPALPGSRRPPAVRRLDAFSPRCRRLWESALDQVCVRLQDYLDRRLRLLGALDGHAFPHETARPGQEEMMKATAEAVGEGGRLLVQAPTGSGKTAAVLAGAIPQALRRGLRLFFLTSKNTQKRIVMDTVAALHGCGADVRTLFLCAREAACPRKLPVCLPSGCPWASEFGSRIAETDIIGKLLSRGIIGEELVESVAREAGVCPYELALEVSRWCELVVCDCNYVYDPHVRLRRFLESKHAARLCAVLLDEASNLPDRARGYWSPEVRESWIRELDRRHRRLAAAGPVLAPWRELMDRVASGSGLFEIGEGDVTGEIGLPPQSPEWPDLLAAVEEPSRALLDLFRSVRDIALLSPDQDSRYRLFLSREEDGAVLQWYCADPSGFLKAEQARLGPVVAFSATLSPMDHYRRQLGLDDADSLETPYPFPRENLGLWIDPAVDTRYRQRRRSLPLLVERLAAMYTAAPGTYLVYFPSYAYAGMAADSLERLGIPLLRQHRAMGRRGRNEMFEGIGSGRGLALLVSGGIFAEGVEFRPGVLRGAVIVGPSLPSLSPRRRFIREWQDARGEDGFEMAFSIPGMVRAVQAAGRVLRSAGQTGTIVLMGRRFASGRMLRLMPSYWFEDGRIPLLSTGMGELKNFWKEKRGDPEGPPL